MQSYKWGIFALALGAFGLGTTEFFPMGLLPTITGIGFTIGNFCSGKLADCNLHSISEYAPTCLISHGNAR